MTEVPDEQRVVAGRYRLLSQLGQGGMGIVWRARDEVLGREVAVKEVRAPGVLPSGDVHRLYDRLEREAWAAARITHRNVVTVYDVASHDGRPWIVMELVRGLSLSDVLDADGPLPPQRAAHIGAEVLAALRSAHEAGVLHRDVKPGNVLIGNDGRVVLTDFGIAMVEGTSALTMTGELIGSPDYLAPERALGRAASPASDLWALGVLLYVTVEGSAPFRLDTPLATLRAVVEEELPPPRRAGALAPVIEGLLRKDPADRLGAEEAGRMLRAVAAGGTAAAPTVAASGPYGPTVTAGTPPPYRPAPHPVQPTVPSAYPATGGATGPTTPMSQTRPRRAGLVLAAGILVLLLAVAGITWALLHNNGSKDKDNNTSAGGSSSSGPSTGSTTPSESGHSSASSGASTPAGGGGGGKKSSPPVQSVKVYVRTVRGSYEGTCPPPQAQAPAFTADFTVGRTPVTVEYRWITANGQGSDSGWKTLDFPDGGAKTQQVDHTELTYEADGTYRDQIRVEVRSPSRVTSDPVRFSVTCRKETPTDGASSPTGSVSPSS
ncbi:serine/threonine-protein kinase [Streptomyces beijiangensis]|uniref:non-specific serine/threonine protein kinase n=1 Tax=Streptomyces beijiangensis TaxID=163361 RepID=A0A939FGC2_9ACTN|nr:serine/threonine-protein kinase [Streptomyces beijiangensis]MBO0516882.1 serine/threonine protein kinase [Streptomyces beijiangensis]